MKRVLKNVVTSFIVSCSILIGAFSYVKADTLTPITTTLYGSYFAETYYYESQNTYIDNIVIDAGLIQFNIGNINSSAFHLHYDFDDLYNGTISVTVTNAINWKLNDCSVAVEGGWFESVPSVSSTAKSKTFVIGVYQSSEIDLVIGHEGRSVTTAAFALTSTYSITENIYTTYDETYYLNNIDDRLLGILSYCSDITDIYDYLTSEMDDTLSSIASDVASLLPQVSGINNYLQKIIEFKIPIEMIPAYCLFSPAYAGDQFLIQNPDEPYPYITFIGNLQSSLFRIESNTTLYFYYLGTTSNWHNSITNANFTFESTRLTDYQIAGKSIFKVSITNPTNSSATTRYLIQYYSTNSQTGVTTDQAGTITPLYFGSGVGMSDSMRSLLGIEDPVVSLLQDFLDNSVVPSGLQQTFINVLTSIGDFYSNLTNFLPDPRVFGDDMLDASSNPEYRITDCLSFVNYFYGEMITTFPALQTFTVLGLSVMVIRMFIK